MVMEGYLVNPRNSTLEYLSICKRSFTSHSGYPGPVSRRDCGLLGPSIVPRGLSTYDYLWLVVSLKTMRWMSSRMNVT